MKEGRWIEVNQSEFPWEQSALTWLRERLPDHDPFRAWSNFEFIDSNGGVNEVDLFLISRYRCYLIEIKSWHEGRLTGDAGSWFWQRSTHTQNYDNPLFLAERKAKKIKSLLTRDFKERVPFIEPVIFLSNPGLKVDLERSGRHGILLPSAHPDSDYVAVLDELTGAFHDDRDDRISNSLSKALARQMDRIGVRPSRALRLVGSYRLRELVDETDFYQDWLAQHESLDSKKALVRVYPIRADASKEYRQQLRLAAEREFRFLDGINHDGFLGVRDFIDSERGPAVLFEHRPDYQRLDFFLAEHDDSLTIDDRVALIRQIAETVDFAHRRHLHHRTLNPRSIIVRREKNALRVKVLNWNTANYGGTDQSTGLTLAGTVVEGLAGADAISAYLAPEFIVLGDASPAALDIFSLGAIAYLILTGSPPASDGSELEAKLAGGQGVKISAVMDGAPPDLDELIQLATDPQVDDRPPTVAEFLDLLTAAEKALRPEEETLTFNPLDAQPADILPGEYLVERRLGKGATALALLVDKDGQSSVLKVALNSEHNDRLRREGRLLHELRHQNIVEYFETLEFAGHVALRLAVAGDKTKSGTLTLADRIREEGRLSLDLLERFGDELLGVVGWLEQQGYSHRDIKPDNIGVSSTRAKKALTLVLFDFSLTGTPVENIKAGTPPYLDPFLRLRNPPRWDLSAERFAAAMTLHEMATGQTPTWGDGRSHPALLDCEVTLDPERFDPSVRDGLVRFFRKALARNYRQRHDNADEMRRDWKSLFLQIDTPTTHHPSDVPITNEGNDSSDPTEVFDYDTLVTGATVQTNLAGLGLSARVLDALERLGVATIGDLLGLPRIELYRQKGLGSKLLTEIRKLADAAAGALATSGKAPEPKVFDALPPDQAHWNLSQIGRQLATDRIEPDQAQTIRYLLGIDGDLPTVCTPSDVATSLDWSKTTVRQHLNAARERWKRQPWMTGIRNDLARALDANGGAMTVGEASKALLARRGAEHDADRVRLPLAVTRSAIETEAVLQEPRYLLRRTKRGPLLVATQQLDVRYAASPDERVRYALALGDVCDSLAELDVLASPVRALDALRAIDPPQGDILMTAARLLRLGVAVSTSADLSSREEVYPVGMAADRALRLGLGSLLAVDKLKVHQIQDRITARYPKAERLPERPELDRLLETCGLPITWDTQSRAYIRTHVTSALVSSSVHRSRVDWSETKDESISPINKRIDAAWHNGGFLVISAAPKYLRQAQAGLEARYVLKTISLETELLNVMKTVSKAMSAKWSVVLQADSAPRTSADWRRLVALAQRAADTLRKTLLAAKEPLLLIQPGLLARYGQLGIIEALAERASHDRNAPVIMTLIPGDQQGGPPSVDGVALPVVLATQRVILSRAWLEQTHLMEPTKRTVT